MILFVAAIQAIPSEINEATMVDGASFWQRTRRVTVPLTRRTILLVTLISVIGSLLAFDQFYIMTAGQPFNQTRRPSSSSISIRSRTCTSGTAPRCP